VDPGAHSDSALVCVIDLAPILDHECEVLYPDAPEEDAIEGYYAFFVFDPDGIRVEVCSWTA
jgi:hypothetical protein